MTAKDCLCNQFNRALKFMVDELHRAPDAENITACALAIDDDVLFQFCEDDQVILRFSDGSSAVLSPSTLQ